jgi:hypothetical protein
VATSILFQPERVHAEKATRLSFHVTRLLLYRGKNRTWNSIFMRRYKDTEMVFLDIGFMQMMVFIDTYQLICALTVEKSF